MSWIKLLLASLTLSSILTAGSRSLSVYSEEQNLEHLASSTCELLVPKAQLGSVVNLYEDAQSILAKSLPQSQFSVEIKEGRHTLYEHPNLDGSWLKIPCEIEGRSNISLSFQFKTKKIMDFALIIWVFINCFWIAIILSALRVTAKTLLLSIQEKLFTEVSLSLGFSDRLAQDNLKISRFVKWLTFSPSSQNNLRNHVELFKTQISAQEQENLALIKSEVQKEEALKRTTEFLEVVRQIQHDMRVPLQTLSAVLAVTQINSEDRKILASTFQKIHGMLNRLTIQEQVANSSKEGVGDQVAEILISEVVLEKNLVQKTSSGIHIDFNFDRKMLNLIEVDRLQFSRMISNLLQNAIEASVPGNRIEITCRRHDPAIFILVKDTGKGISPEIASQLFQKGKTFGKSGGSGLGLFHAKTCVERWHGEILMETAPGNGTTIIIQLPLSSNRPVLISDLDVDLEKINVLVDDQVDVFKALEKKFDQQLIYFDSPQSFKAWQSDHKKTAHIQYLFDFNLEDKLTGLDLINDLEEPSRAVLVTSDYDNPKVITASQNLGFRIFPKYYLPTI